MLAVSLAAPAHSSLASSQARVPVVPCYVAYEESTAAVDFPAYGGAAGRGGSGSHRGDTLVSATEKAASDALLRFFVQFTPAGSLPESITAG